MSEKLLRNISEIEKDLNQSIAPEELLASQVKDRIESKCERYDREFSKYLNLIEERELSSNDIRGLGRTLEVLFDSMTYLYEEVLKFISLYEKNLLDK